MRHKDCTSDGWKGNLFHLGGVVVVYTKSQYERVREREIAREHCAHFMAQCVISESFRLSNGIGTKQYNLIRVWFDDGVALVCDQGLLQRATIL